MDSDRGAEVDPDTLKPHERIERLERWLAEISEAFPAVEHKTHHDFVRRLIEQDRLKAERWEKIKTHVGGWAIVAFLSAVGTGVWQAFQHIKDHWR